MSPILGGIVVVTILLLILFLLIARARSDVSPMRALCTWLARPFSFLTFMCLRVATSCKNGCVDVLEKWPIGVETHEQAARGSLWGVAMTRLLYLVISACVLLGEFPLGNLRSAALYHLLASDLRLPLSLFTGLLWLLVPGVWGLLLAETVGLLPKPTRLFEQMPNTVRWGVGIGAGVLLVASLVAVWYFNAFGQCVLLQDTCANDATLQIATVSGFGVLLALAGIIALYGLLVGLSVPLALLLGVLYCVCTVLALVFGILGHGLETFGQPYLTPLTNSFLQSLETAPAQLLLIPAGSRDGNTTQQQEESMANSQRNTTMIGIGNFGFRFEPLLGTAMEELGAMACIRVRGVVDLSRPRANQVPTSYPGLLNITPLAQQIDEALAHAAAPELAYQRILAELVNKIVEAHTPSRGLKGHVLVALDMLLIEDASEALRSLKNRLPTHAIVIITALPEHDLRDQRVATANECLLALAQEGVIEDAMVIDVRSPFAKKVGEEVQEHYLAKTLASLMVGHTHSDHNPTFGQVCERLGSLSPCTGLSFASGRVAPGKSPFLYGLVKPLLLHAPQRGQGDINDCIIQTRAQIDQVLREHTSQAAQEQIRLDKPMFLLINVPIPLNDKRFKEFASTIRAYLAQTFPSASAIIVRGNGTHDPRLVPGYHIQVSALYPLASHTVMAQTPSGDTAVVVAPDPVQTSAHVNGRKRK